ncbi:MAG: molybdopterin-dependent oxidoreductase [Candidatus Latescibacteria bacterium]|nr:molybdopterin-dependent oxidoreductase [Candidatus Latescibacterota bacterium]
MDTKDLPNSPTTIDRRQFLKYTGAGAVAGTVSPLLPRLVPTASAAVPGTKNYEGALRIPSCCNMCGGQTGIECLVVDGRVVSIRPNSHNPNGFSNISTDFFANAVKEGAVMCPKGNAGIMTLYDPDRVKKPLRRTNPEKGIGVDPKWKEISWEEAYAEIAGRLQKLREAGEAHKLLWFSEDHSFTHIQGDFCKLYGTSNYSMHSNLCDTARKASFKMVMGHDRPLMDALQSRYILLFGWNPLSATKWAHLPRIVTRGLENGAKLVVVDPNFSYTAQQGEWVPIRPATDGALALAMAHVIIRDQLYDETFVRDWTVGFEEFSKYVADKTPQWAEGITSVPAATIERLGREFATTRPSLADVWSGPGQHSNAVQGGRAIACLNALVGSYDRPGTMVIPNNKGNKHIEVEADETAAKTVKMERFDGLTSYPFGHKSGVYCETFTRLVEGTGPYQPKIGVVFFQNLMMSVPGTQTVEQALKKLEFLVVNDIYLSETALMADIVIPGATYLERYDLNTHWVTWPVLGLRQPVVKPLFGQPTEYEFVAELGRRLGLKDKEGGEVFRVGRISGQPIEDLTAWYEEWLSKEIKEGEPKITLEELKALPGAVWVSQKGTAYEKYAQPIPEEKLKDALVEGTMVFSKKKDGTKDKQIGVMKDGKAYAGFSTPSGKVEFYNAKFAEKKDATGKPVAPLPVYEPRDWMPDAEYPLYSINWKEASHTHTRTHNNAWLVEIKPLNPLRINPKTAAKLGLKDGDEVWVESKYGKVKAKLQVTQGIHPEVVGLLHGFGHWGLGKIAKGRGTSDAVLRPTRAEPLSGQAMHKQNCVKVYKA